LIQNGWCTPIAINCLKINLFLIYECYDGLAVKKYPMGRIIVQY